MEWDPTQFLRESTAPRNPFAILVLNHPINENVIGVLQRNACFTICADAGANRFYRLMKRQGRESTHLPNAIVGDFDSINPRIRKHYEDLQVTVIQDPDQYSTDFTKCLRYLQTHSAEIISSAYPSSSSGETTPAARRTLDVVILGGLGGRVDQAFSQIHHLYMAVHERAAMGKGGVGEDGDRGEGQLYLISEESISFVLQSGKSRISTPRTAAQKAGMWKESGSDDNENTVSTVSPEQGADLSYLFENVGILPIAGPARLKTHGLEWDVEDWPTKFGGQISTSNHIRADEVTVETDLPVLFTVELAGRLKFGCMEK